MNYEYLGWIIYLLLVGLAYHYTYEVANRGR